MENRYWDEEKVIKQIAKATTSKIVVSRVKKNGKEFFTIREWYCTKSDPTWKPGKAGITIPICGDIAMQVVAAMTAEMVG